MGDQIMPAPASRRGLALSTITLTAVIAILDYFEPLSEWLAEENRGRGCGWPH
jgi:hypothetical protein